MVFPWYFNASTYPMNMIKLNDIHGLEKTMTMTSIFSWSMTFFHIHKIVMGHEFSTPLKTHEINHHENLGVKFMGFF